MGTLEILLIAAVIVIPLAIAVAVTLWTLEPAARRAERARRGRRRVAGPSAATPLLVDSVNNDAVEPPADHQASAAERP